MVMRIGHGAKHSTDLRHGKRYGVKLCIGNGGAGGAYMVAKLPYTPLRLKYGEAYASVISLSHSLNT